MHLARFLILLIVLTGGASAAVAQTDPKFEYKKADDLKDVDETEWNATAEAGLVFTTGNSRTTTLSGTVKAQRKEKRNMLSLEATGTFARASNLAAVDTDANGMISADELDRVSTTSAKNLAGKLRYDRFLTSWDALFIAALGGVDPIAGKDFAGGGQLGYARTMYKSDKHTVTLEGGYDFSYEDYVADTNPSVSIHSARGFLGYEGVLTETTKLTASGEALANLNDTTVAKRFDDIRATAKLELSTKITKDIALSISFLAKYDHAPAPAALPAGLTADAANPPLAEELDTTTKASLIVTLL
ncbi:MAG TPA: DUF481 domain-containing protein [Kofleriaceae bacterium]|jgi:hypothetical protein|nr:DUF481 domain-containing protein [Kofleriaceae bacterium]